MLADSIVSLSALRTRLECETCHSAELALGLFGKRLPLSSRGDSHDGLKRLNAPSIYLRFVIVAPISFEDGATMPDIPSTCFVEAAARQLESWDFASNQVDEINAET